MRARGDDLESDLVERPVEAQQIAEERSLVILELFGRSSQEPVIDRLLEMLEEQRREIVLIGRQIDLR